MTVTNRVAPPVAVLELGDAPWILDEASHVLEQRIASVTRRIHVHSTRVEASNLLFYLCRRVGEEDGVAQALGHFLDAIEPYQTADASDKALGDPENSAGLDVLAVGC